jgi:hemolysin III
MRNQATQEEIANSILHGAGVLLAVISLVLLVTKYHNQNTPLLVTSIIFSSSLTMLFLMSVLHHSLVPKTAKHVFLVLDYTAIYIVIAATFTPFLVLLAKPPYMLLLIIIWILAITGITLSAVFSKKIKTIAPIFYIIMGWLSVFILKPLTQAVGNQPVMLLIAGGVAYTVGTYFYLNDHKEYHHAIWHVFVLVGAISHIAAIYTIK